MSVQCFEQPLLLKFPAKATGRVFKIFFLVHHVHKTCFWGESAEIIDGYVGICGTRPFLGGSGCTARAHVHLAEPKIPSALLAFSGTRQYPPGGGKNLGRWPPEAEGNHQLTSHSRPDPRPLQMQLTRARPNGTGVMVMLELIFFIQHTSFIHSLTWLNFFLKIKKKIFFN